MPDQLAYVFWHWPRPEIAKESYETKLVAFLNSLNSKKPDGFVEALAFASIHCHGALSVTIFMKIGTS